MSYDEPQLVESAKVEFVEDLWVQCDEPSCSKWRRLPPGTVVNNQTRWYCYMNPDTRYNSCDLEEELYDERNEILLTTPEDIKIRRKTKRRRKDSRSEGQNLVTKLKGELQKRKEWCQNKLKRVNEEDLTNWTADDFRLIAVHAPEEIELLIQSTDLLSGLSYFDVVVSFS